MGILPWQLACQKRGLREKGKRMVQTCAAGLKGAADRLLGSAGLLAGEAAATDAGMS